MLAFVLLGCGDRFSRKHDSFTEVQIKQGRTTQGFYPLISDPAPFLTDEFEPTVLDGGGMVFALNADDPSKGGRKFISNGSSGATLNWLVPNGKYYFYAIGYKQANMSGDPDCGLALGDDGTRGGVIELKGGKKTISIGVSIAKCIAAPFGFDLATYKLETCKSNVDMGLIIAISSTCGTSLTDDTVQSVRLGYFDEDAFGARIDTIDTGKSGLTTCIDTDAVIGNFALPKLVTGKTSSEATLRVGVDILTFTSRDCVDLRNVYRILGGPSYAANFTAFTEVYKDGKAASGFAKWIDNASSGSTASGKLWVK